MIKTNPTLDTTLLKANTNNKIEIEKLEKAIKDHSMYDCKIKTFYNYKDYNGFILGEIDCVGFSQPQCAFSIGLILNTILNSYADELITDELAKAYNFGVDFITKPICLDYGDDAVNAYVVINNDGKRTIQFSLNLNAINDILLEEEW